MALKIRLRLGAGLRKGSESWLRLCDHFHTKTRHLHHVPHQQFSIRDRWMIPRLAGDRLEAHQFFVPFRSRLHEGKLAVARENHEMSVGEEQLSVTVASILPFAFAGLG